MEAATGQETGPADLRKKMVAALKSAVVPILRSRGFKGTFPHFRRFKENGVDLFTFQFDRNGGGFIIEIARGPAGGFTTSWGKFIPPELMKSWDMDLKNRARVYVGGSRKGGRVHSWYRFDHGEFAICCEQVLERLRDADVWFEGGASDAVAEFLKNPQ